VLLLALETATESAGVALLRDGELLAERTLPARRQTSETLLPALLGLLADHGLGVDALDAFAVSIGPGSFTGLRVGVATVKGLAFGERRCVAAVPTLAALAATRAASPGLVAAVLDARRGEVYAAAHRGGDLLAPPLWGPSVLRPESLAARLEAGWSVVGDGVPVVAKAVRARLGDRVELVGPPAGRADAAAVGRLGALALAAGKGIAPAELAPDYGRRAEAEERRLRAR